LLKILFLGSGRAEVSAGGEESRRSGRANCEIQKFKLHTRAEVQDTFLIFSYTEAGKLGSGKYRRT
jgi:hypothetical protein